MSKQQAIFLAESNECNIDETPCGNIWLNAPDGKSFISSGATTSLIFNGDQRDRSGKTIKPCWKLICKAIKSEIDFGFEEQ